MNSITKIWKNAVPVQKFFSVLAVVTLVVTPFTQTNTVSANHDPFQGIPQTVVTVCHFNNGQGGSYNPNTVSINSSGEPEQGHGNHANDIIPPYHWGANGSFAGQNWDANGQSIYNEGSCNGQGDLPDPEETTGTIIIEKQTDPDGAVEDFEFDPSWSQQNFFLADDEQESSGELSPGTYEVIELASDWTLTNPVSCTGQVQSVVTPFTGGVEVTLVAGETVTCVFNNTEPEEPTGSLRVCKVAMDSNGNVIVGAGVPDTTFTIEIDPVTPDEDPFNVDFTTPLALNTDLAGIGNDQELDAECVTYEDISLDGSSYNYSQEAITGDGAGFWETPLYDELEQTDGAAGDFEEYNTSGNSNGNVLINENTPDRTIIIKNTLQSVANIVAYKVVCTDESDLPNWGEGADNIDADTAQDWVADHDSCSFEEGWEFQWGPDDAFDPGDTMLGEAGDPWTTFGPTDVNGMTTIALTEEQVGDNTHLWFREVLQEGYIPFTHDSNGNTNVDDVSAEVYCHEDGLNYDNFDRIDGIDVNDTFYCVAWNHANPGSITIVKEVVSDVAEWAFDFEGDLGEFSLNNGSSSVTFTGLNPDEYLVNELVPEDWSDPIVSCDDDNSGAGQDENDQLVVALGAGENVTCTFTNRIGDDGGGGNNDDGDFTLTVTTSGEGGGLVLGNGIECARPDGGANDCAETYASGTIVTLTADPNSESNFNSSWSGACTGNSLTCDITMDGNKDVDAHFGLNVTTGGGGGTSGGGGGTSGGGGGQVLGDSDSTGEVLGEQIAQAPLGAPNTGSGGAAQGGLYGTLLILAGLYGISRSRKVQV